MTLENTAGLGVNNHYGHRETEYGKVGGGKLPVQGSVDEIVIYVKGSDFDGGTSFDTKAYIPAGSLVREAYAEVTEAFALGGTTPTMNVGTSGSAGTNYSIELSEANAEATGQYDGTPAGTHAAVLAADTTIAVELDGTTPTVTDAGQMKVVIRYIKI